MSSLRRWTRLATAGLLSVFVLVGCGGGEATPTRTPIPTWTPTPVVDVPVVQEQAGQEAAPAAPGVQVVDPTQVAQAIATDTPTPVPTATATVPPTDTPTPEPTATPTETPTPEATPTPTETPTPTPEPTYPFELEETAKFATESLAPNVVRIFAYIYSPAEFGLGDYKLSVIHNGSPLVVDEVSFAGIPDQTREDPGPFTRFTNFSVIFVEPQAGEWRIQLIDSDGQPAGTEAIFSLTADENTRELYVRYRLQELPEEG